MWCMNIMICGKTSQYEMVHIPLCNISKPIDANVCYTSDKYIFFMLKRKVKYKDQVVAARVE